MKRFWLAWNNIPGHRIGMFADCPIELEMGDVKRFTPPNQNSLMTYLDKQDLPDLHIDISPGERKEVLTITRERLEGLRDTAIKNRNKGGISPEVAYWKGRRDAIDELLEGL